MDVKYRVLFIGLFATGIAFSSVALADEPGADWLAKSQVTEKLKEQGLSDVTALEADDGHWEGEAVQKGKIVEFHADPHTGKLISVKPKH